MVSAVTRIGIPAGAVLAVFVMLAAGASMASAEVDNDQGTVSYYTYTVDFAFRGTDAQTILWDFGFENPDGTRATSTEWNPSGIVFPAKGMYTVTQIVSNTVGIGTAKAARASSAAEAHEEAVVSSFFIISCFFIICLFPGLIRKLFHFCHEILNYLQEGKR